MNNLKCLLITASVIAFASGAHAKSEVFRDVQYTFDEEKTKAAENSFHFLRSYVDYFYLLIDANKADLQAFSNQLSSFSGWCVGDAHAENFGVLIQKDQSSLFTMNDMDDFGPCPVAFDLYRFMVSCKLYDENIALDQIVSSYIRGIKNESIAKPDSIKNLIDKSQKKGSEINSKKIVSNRIVRDYLMTEVNADEERQILAALNNLNSDRDVNFKVIDLVSTRKVGGGSGGLLRYEVLIADGNKLIQLELKEEINPSIYSVASASIPNLSERIQKAIAIEQGSLASPFYFSVQINNRSMLVRPRFSGNVGVSLGDYSKNENAEIIYYEAYTLGLIHSHSVNNVKEYGKLIKSISNKDLESDVKKMVKLFDNKFSMLKNNVCK